MGLFIRLHTYKLFSVDVKFGSEKSQYTFSNDENGN